MKNLRWHKVGTSDFYGEWESLIHRGKEAKIKHGMRIDVRWPDKSVTPERLIVVCPDNFETRHLFVEHTHHGAKVRIPLAGLHVGLWERQS
jgi:hypothetical protein